MVVPLPDEDARAAILGVHLRRVPLASQHERDLACEAVAKITAGALVRYVPFQWRLCGVSSQLWPPPLLAAGALLRRKRPAAP